MKERLIAKLNEQFNPTFLEVIDESHLHKGHAGYRAGGETHFKIKISSSSFLNHSRVSVHRMINQLFGAELVEQIHALSIEIIT